MCIDYYGKHQEIWQDVCPKSPVKREQSNAKLYKHFFNLHFLRIVDGIVLTYLAVVNRVVHGDVPLEGDPHRHEDGGGHGDGDGRVQEVGESGLKIWVQIRHK